MGSYARLDLISCPSCAAPAEVVDRYVLNSTDGPLEHATVVCVRRHRYTLLVEQETSAMMRRTGLLAVDPVRRTTHVTDTI
jgi:hypothetical protein